MANTQKKQPQRSVTDSALTYDERTAAGKLGISYITLFRRRQAGLVPFYRIGSRVLYDDACLAELLEKSRQRAA